MVADDAEGILYVGVEEEGIYRLPASPTEQQLPQLLPGSDSLNPRIAYDIEGLALFRHKNKKYLLASSQENFSDALFDLEKGGNYLTSFTITEGPVDGVEETDGLDIITSPLNAAFPQGMLVVQDGHNTDGDLLKSQNFKYIPFERITALLR